MVGTAKTEYSILHSYSLPPPPKYIKWLPSGREKEQGGKLDLSECTPPDSGGMDSNLSQASRQKTKPHKVGI